MSTTKLVFSLQALQHGWWQAFLSDGKQEATITASYTPEEPLLPLLWAIRRLLLGADESNCTWWGEPGQYRWHFSRTQQRLQINILWFNGSHNRSDEKGETVLRIECDLLAFAKRLTQQLDQISYEARKPAIAPEDYQKFKDAIAAFKQ